MLFKASSRVNIAGALIVMMMVMLLVPQQVHAEQVNGEYTIGFNIMHADKKNASIAEGYWNQPAKVYIKDSSIRVRTTINKHAWVTKFAVSYNSIMSDVKTISADEAANARITEFQVANLTDLVESNVSVTIDEIDYEHSYTMYFKFKPETLALVKAEEPQVPAAPGQAAAPAPAQEVESADQAEEQKEAPALTPAPTAADAAEQSDRDADSQADQSGQDIDIAVPGAEEETAESAGEADSDGGSSNELSNVAEQEQDASDISAVEEAADAAAVPVEEALEEGSNGSNITIIIAIIIVLLAIISVIVYRARHNKQ